MPLISLIEISKQNQYLKIFYPTPNKTRSIRVDDVKEVRFDDNLGDVVLIESRPLIVTLHFSEVEDPANPGFPFIDTEDLWDELIRLLSLSDVNDFMFMDGNNLYFMDGNNFIFNN